MTMIKEALWVQFQFKTEHDFGNMPYRPFRVSCFHSAQYYRKRKSDISFRTVFSTLRLEKGR